MLYRIIRVMGRWLHFLTAWCCTRIVVATLILTWWTVQQIKALAIVHYGDLSNATATFHLTFIIITANVVVELQCVFIGEIKR